MTDSPSPEAAAGKSGDGGDTLHDPKETVDVPPDGAKKDSKDAESPPEDVVADPKNAEPSVEDDSKNVAPSAMEPPANEPEKERAPKPKEPKKKDRVTKPKASNAPKKGDGGEDGSFSTPKASVAPRPAKKITNERQSKPKSNVLFAEPGSGKATVGLAIKQSSKRDAFAADLMQAVSKKQKFGKAPKATRYDGIQRKAESECFSVGIVQLKPASLVATLNSDNPHEPKSKTEAIAIAETCLYGGLRVPNGVYAKCGDSLPSLNPSYVYSPLPVFATKGKCTEYSNMRDAHYKLEYDSAKMLSRGGTSTRGDQKMNGLMAENMGETLGTRTELDPDAVDNRVSTLEAALYGMQVRMTLLTNAFDIVVEEESLLRDAFTEYADAFGDDVPHRSAPCLRVLESIETGEVSRTNDAPSSDDDESFDDDESSEEN